MPRKHAIGAVLLWSTVVSAFKLSLRYMSLIQLLFWAFLTSLILYGVLYFRNFRFSRENLRPAYLGLGSAVVWASYWLLNLRDWRPLVEKVFWNFLFGFAYAPATVLGLVMIVGGIVLGRGYCRDKQ